MSIAYVYGHTVQTTDLKTDIYLILAGNGAKEAMKKIGIEISKEVTKKAVDKYITKEVMNNIWKVVGRKIITKAGEKSLTSFMRIVPLVGERLSDIVLIGFGLKLLAIQPLNTVGVEQAFLK